MKSPTKVGTPTPREIQTLPSLTSNGDDEKLRDRLPAIGRLLTVILFVWVPVFSQDQLKVIEWPAKPFYNSRANATSENHLVDRIDDVEIESILVEGRLVHFGESFNANDEWLKNISFQVKNVSTKSIGQFQITLIMPELGPMHRIQIQYFCRECIRKVNPVAFDPGDVRELTLPDPIYAWARSIINEQTTLTKISKAQVLISYLMLADGSMISSDCMKTADLKNKCPFGSP